MSAAATVLGFTQSAVSQQVAALEREVGATLIDRARRPLAPTAEGAALRPHVERVLAAVGSAESVLGDLRSGALRLRLAAFPSALSAFMPAAVRDLRRRHPTLALQVYEQETREATERLRRGEVDVAVVHHMPGVAAPDTSAFRRRRLLVDALRIVAPERHRLARQESIAVADLKGEPLILPRRGTPAGRFRSLVEHLCAQAGFAPDVAFELEDLPAAQAFAAAGIALVPMHALTLTTLPAGATSRPLAEGDAASRVVEALATADGSPAVDDLLDGLGRAARAFGRRGPGD